MTIPITSATINIASVAALRSPDRNHWNTDRLRTGMLIDFAGIRSNLHLEVPIGTFSQRGGLDYGEVIRTDPKVDGYRPRIDQNGNRTDSHNTGEIVH